MAARTSSTLAPGHREAIRTSMLINRLQSFALSEMDSQSGKPVAMSGDQVRAALGLLRKTMPDLAATQLTGDSEKPVQFVLIGAPEAKNPAAWAERYAPK